ncbi:MAG: nucleotidyltransferase domain-containing protein [Spirochaetota bacterium]
MQQRIQSLLHSITKEKQIHILYAVESGSRAWGFASPDSDYDIRFIYAYPYKKYLSIENQKETLEFPITEDKLDIAGWEIRKLLRLASKSNAIPFEWLQSPIVYEAGKDGFREKLWQLLQNYFSQQAMLHHYLGIAKGAANAIDNGHIKIKKYFYILRPILAAMWVRQHKQVPPMVFQQLLPLLQEHASIEKIIQDLLLRKEQAKEGEAIALIPELEEFLLQERYACEAYKAQLGKVHPTSNREALSEFFRIILSGYKNA